VIARRSESIARRRRARTARWVVNKRRDVEKQKEWARDAVDQLFTVAEAAKQLATTEGHVRRLIFQRKMRFVRVGRLVRVPQSAIDEYVAAHTVEPVQ
jgi:excisionase family DNA binding protein